MLWLSLDWNLFVFKLQFLRVFHTFLKIYWLSNKELWLIYADYMVSYERINHCGNIIYHFEENILC